MSYLEHFTDDQRELLISLPYRAGLWMSESDESGGDESQEAELITLESLIIGYAEDFLKSEFVEELMRQTLAAKERWGEWGNELDNVPQECQSALERMEPKDVLSFKQALIEIATAVAMAFREFDEEEQPVVEKVRLYSQYYWNCFLARVKKQQPPNLDAILNISRAEQEVLEKLSQALEIDLEGNPVDDAAA